MTGVEGEFDAQPRSEGPLTVRLLLESDAERTVGSIAVTISDQLGTKLVNADTIKLGKTIRLQRGTTVVTVRIESLHLTPGTYVLGWWVADPLGSVHDFVERSVHLELADVVEGGLGVRPQADGAVTASFDVDAEPAAGIASILAERPRASSTASSRAARSRPTRRRC